MSRSATAGSGICDEAGRDPVPTYRQLAEQYHAPRLRGPFNSMRAAMPDSSRPNSTNWHWDVAEGAATLAGSRSAALRRAARRPGPGHGVSPRRSHARR